MLLLNPIFDIFIEQLRELAEAALDEPVDSSLQAWQPVQVSMEGAQKQFENQLAASLATLSSKKQARMLVQVLGSFKEWEGHYGPAAAWLCKPVDLACPEIAAWALAQWPNGAEGYTREQMAARLIQSLLVSRESKGKAVEYSRWIFGGSIDDNRIIPADYAAEVADELVSYHFQDAHSKVWTTYARLVGESEAASWMLGKEARHEASLQQPGQPYHPITVQESYDLYRGIEEFERHEPDESGASGAVVAAAPAPVTLAHYLTIEAQALLPFLRTEFSGTQARHLAMMVFALDELGLLSDKGALNNKARLFEALSETLDGMKPTRQGFSAALNRLQRASADEKAKIKSIREQLARQLAAS